MTAVISSGVVILDRSDEVFVCHTTGTARWDLPKGIIEPNESALEAVLRETWEETSLRLPPDRLADLGLFDYLPQKRLHLFALRVAPGAFDPAACRCHTTFLHRTTGRAVLEVDAYAWKPLARLPEWCGKNLSRVLGGLDRERLRALPEVAALEVAAQGSAAG